MEQTVDTDNPVAHAATRVASTLQGWPPFVTTIVLFAGAIIIAAILWMVLVRALPRRFLVNQSGIADLIHRARHILFFALAVILISSVIPAAPLSDSVRLAVLHVLSACFIVLIGWSVIIAIDTLSAHKLANRPEDIQSDVTARKLITQWEVLRRASYVLTVLITAAAALMVFPAVRDYGVSLLASAGAAGLVVGLAARPVLSNLIAGIQIAITQPLRVEDAVVINDQWGWVEEITSTYVVVRIWNWQRMVVPLAWLLEHPFQNWTRESSELIGDVYWNLDYTVPVDDLREKLKEIVQATPLWSGKVVVLQVTDATPTTIQLRALVSARNSGEAWDLRCLVREQMIAFLQERYPDALPKHRLALENQPAQPSTAPRPPVETESV